MHLAYILPISIFAKNNNFYWNYDEKWPLLMLLRPHIMFSFPSITNTVKWYKFNNVLVLFHTYNLLYSNLTGKGGRSSVCF